MPLEVERTRQSTTPSRDKRATVLVADDDAAARETVADILRESGFRVVTARDGQAAVEWMRRSRRPIAILLDLSMPRMNGRDVLEWIRARRRLAAVPVCLISAEEDSVAGVKLAVRKPLLSRQLKTILSFIRGLAESSRRPGDQRAFRKTLLTA